MAVVCLAKAQRRQERARSSGPLRLGERLLETTAVPLPCATRGSGQIGGTRTQICGCASVPAPDSPASPAEAGLWTARHSRFVVAPADGDGPFHVRGFVLADTGIPVLDHLLELIDQYKLGIAIEGPTTVALGFLVRPRCRMTLSVPAHTKAVGNPPGLLIRSLI
jgi:hypothetical protein